MEKIIVHRNIRMMFHVTGATRVAAGMIGNILELLANAGIHMILRSFGSVNHASVIGIVMIQDIFKFRENVLGQKQRSSWAVSMTLRDRNSPGKELLEMLLQGSQEQSTELRLMKS